MIRQGPHRTRTKYRGRTDTQQGDLIRFITKIIRGEYTDRQQGDLISLITKIRGDAQTDRKDIS
jgi:hypothetical protein